MSRFRYAWSSADRGRRFSWIAGTWARYRIPRKRIPKMKFKVRYLDPYRGNHMKKDFIHDRGRGYPTLVTWRSEPVEKRTYFSTRYIRVWEE